MGHLQHCNESGISQAFSGIINADTDLQTGGELNEGSGNCEDFVWALHLIAGIHTQTCEAILL